jgi:hypothetical protein
MKEVIDDLDLDNSQYAIQLKKKTIICCGNLKRNGG